MLPKSPALAMRLAFAIGTLAMLTLDPAGAARKGQMGDERIVTFEASPFPYFGDVPEQGRPTAFLQTDEAGRRFHDAPRGGRLFLEQTYGDRRTLLVTPRYFDPSRPDAAIILFFHGNLATLARDVAARQGVPRQLVASHANAVLVAPQLAVDALDSSAGRFWEPGFLAIYLREAAARLAEGKPYGADDLNRLPVIIVAYSGGYLPAAFSLHYASMPGRIRGVILLDALFGEEAKFREWIEETADTAFFVSAYSKASAAQNGDLMQQLKAAGVHVSMSLPDRIQPGAVIFASAPRAAHDDFMTQAWMRDPLTDVLRRLR